MQEFHQVTIAEKVYVCNRQHPLFTSVFNGIGKYQELQSERYYRRIFSFQFMVFHRFTADSDFLLYLQTSQIEYRVTHYLLDITKSLQFHSLPENCNDKQ